MRSPLFTALFLAASVLPAAAKFARVWEPVPTDRLLANVGRYVKEHPKDARGHYTLGRLHALIYSAGVKPPEDLDVIIKDWQTGKPAPLPGFPPFATVRANPPAISGKLPEPLRAHLTASLGEYRWAVAMAPKDPLYLLGYAWMLEQSAPHAAEAPESAKEAGIPATDEAFRDRALTLYRQAYALSAQKELDAPDRNGNAGDNSIATEAGEGILSILGKRSRVTGAERDEMDRVKRNLAEIQGKPAFVTPVILSLSRAARLDDLLSGRSARFDLAASGRAELWPWLKPDTGILVWDPQHTGRIVSGRQLFGSRTWQMFWRNGYEALAALDDDANGTLEGKELDGIAVWFDRNGNGRSDPREVIPVTALGITRIAVRPDGERDGVPWAEAGIELADGRRLSTWDWTPTSIPEAPGRSRPLVTWN